jgi:hypothetical protein
MTGLRENFRQNFGGALHVAVRTPRPLQFLALAGTPSFPAFTCASSRKEVKPFAVHVFQTV